MPETFNLSVPSAERFDISIPDTTTNPNVRYFIDREREAATVVPCMTTDVLRERLGLNHSADLPGTYWFPAEIPESRLRTLERVQTVYFVDYTGHVGATGTIHLLLRPDDGSVERAYFCVGDWQEAQTDMESWWSDNHNDRGSSMFDTKSAAANFILMVETADSDSGSSATSG